MSIFPNSCPDADRRIVTFSPAKERVVLSGVNRTAYKVLSNDPHFKNLFFQLFPCFNNGMGKLQYVCDNYPENCWKVNCCVLEQNGPSFTTRFNFSFLSTPFPAQLYLVKSNYESRLKAICGEPHENPSSPIHQARQAAKRAKDEHNLIVLEMNTLAEALAMDYGEDLISEEPNVTFEELSASDERFMHIQRMFEKEPIAQSNYDEKLEIYNELEKQRAELKTKLSDIDLKLNRFSDPATRDRQFPPFCVKNESTLSLTFSQARQVESFSKELPLLRAIRDAIQVLLDNPGEVSPSALEKIPFLINSHPCKIEIWKDLHQRSGNRIIKENWAETHFREFLPELKYIITRMIATGTNSEKLFYDYDNTN
jgi:hypothetical protein